MCISESKDVQGVLISGKRQRAQQSMGHIEISQLGLVLANLAAEVIEAPSELKDQYVNAQEVF